MNFFWIFIEAKLVNILFIIQMELLPVVEDGFRELCKDALHVASAIWEEESIEERDVSTSRSHDNRNAWTSICLFNWDRWSKIFVMYYNLMHNMICFHIIAATNLNEYNFINNKKILRQFQGPNTHKNIG